MKATLFTVLLFVCSALCDLRVIRNQICPTERPVHYPVDKERISGIWYVMQHYSTPGDQCECTIYDVHLDDPKSDVHFRGCCRSFESNADRCDKVIKTTSYTKSAFEEYDAPKGNFNDGNHFIYAMLETDYEHYAIGYRCKNLPNGQSHEDVMVAVRMPMLSQEMQERIDVTMDKYFDQSLLRKVEQDKEKCKGLKETLLNFRKLKE